MSKFKLNQNWNGHFAGEEVTYPDMYDKMILLKNIGTKIEKAENKMIVPDYKNVKKTRKKKA